MVVSTALMLIGAGLGAAGGYSAQEERIRQSKRKLGLLELSGYNNGKAKEAAAKLLKGQVSISSLEASSQAESDALAVGEAKGAMEANAGASGLTGGTPFFQLASVASRSMRSAQKAASARALSLEGQLAQGAMTIDEYRMRGEELSYQTQDALETNRYLDSGFAWAMALGTGALSGAAAANRASTTLEGLGVNMDADPIGDFIAKQKLKAEMAGNGGGAGDVTDLAASGDVLLQESNNASAGNVGTGSPEMVSTARMGDALTSLDKSAIGAIYSLMDAGESDIPMIGDVRALSWWGTGQGPTMPTTAPDTYPQPMAIHAPVKAQVPFVAAGASLFDAMDTQDRMTGFFLGSPDLTGYDVRRPKPMKFGAFGNEGMFQIN